MNFNNRQYNNWNVVEVYVLHHSGRTRPKATRQIRQSGYQAVIV